MRALVIALAPNRIQVQEIQIQDHRVLMFHQEKGKKTLKAQHKKVFLLFISLFYLNFFNLYIVFL